MEHHSKVDLNGFNAVLACAPAFGAIAAFLFISVSAKAATEVYWDAGGADNNWSTQANWSSDTVPNSASYNARFKSHVGDADVVSVTVDGIYEISQFLATPSQNNVKYVFTATGENGIAATSSTDTFIIGKNGSYMSDITFDGGTYTGKYLRISRDAGNGTLTLRNGAKMFNEQVRVGNSAAGYTAKLLIEGGAEYTHVATPYNLFFIVSDKSGTGVVEVDGGTFKALSSNSDFKVSIGGNGNSDASFNMKGGTAEMTAFVVGGVCDKKSNSNQYYIRTDRNESGMTARLNVSGGTLTVHQNSIIGANTSADAVAELNISGGKVNIDAECLYVGETGNASLTMTGGELVFKDTQYGLTWNHARSGKGIVNLSGGVLTIPNFRTDYVQSGSELNFNGTVVKPTRDNNTFLEESALAVTIDAGNLIIDTDYDITINASMGGVGGIVKRGSGVVTLRGNNTFAGSIVVEPGAGAVVSRNDGLGPFVVDGTEGGAYASPLQLHTDTLEGWLEDSDINSFTAKYGADGAHTFELPRIIGVRYGAGTDEVLLYTNLCVGTNVAWSAGGKSGSFATKTLAPRTIMASPNVAVNNVRDLGGWPLVGGNGRTTNQGVVYRGGRLDAFYDARADDRASNLLTTQLGIKTEIDLRGKTDDFKDIAAKKKVVVANPSAATIEEETYCYDGDAENTFTTSPWLPELRYYLCGMDFNGNMLNAQDDTASYTIFTNQIRRAFHLLGTPGNLPAYYHCKIGCDRTGIVSMLLLGLCGVEEETIYRDYLASSFAKCDDSARTMNRVDTFFRYLYRGYTPQGDWRGHSYGESMSAQCRAYLEMCGVTAAELDNITTAMTGETMAQVLARVDAAESAEGYRTVSFVAYPGSSSTNGVRRLAAGETPTAPVSNTPTRDGFAFAGWDLAGETNATIYAVWTAQASDKTTDIAIDFSDPSAKSANVQKGILDVAAGADFSGGLRIGAKGAVAIRTTDVDSSLSAGGRMLVLKCPEPVFDVTGDTLADSVFLYGHVFGYALAYDPAAGGIVATVTSVDNIASTRYVRTWIGGNDVGSTAATVHIDNATPWNVGNPSTAGSMDVLVFCGDAWMCMYFAKNHNNNCPTDALAIRGGTLSIRRTNTEHPNIDRRRVVGNGTLCLDHVGFQPSDSTWGLYAGPNVAVDFSSVHNNSDTWARNATFEGDVFVTNGQLRCYAGVTFNGNVYFGENDYAASTIESAATINGTWTVNGTTVDFCDTTPVFGANAKLVLVNGGALTRAGNAAFPQTFVVVDGGTARLSAAEAEAVDAVTLREGTLEIDVSALDVSVGTPIVFSKVKLADGASADDVAVTVLGADFDWSYAFDAETGALAVTPAASSGVDNYWVGGESGTWSDAACWSRHVAPATTHKAIFTNDVAVTLTGWNTGDADVCHAGALAVGADVTFTASGYKRLWLYGIEDEATVSGTGSITLEVTTGLENHTSSVQTIPCDIVFSTGGDHTWLGGNAGWRLTGNVAVDGVMQCDKPVSFPATTTGNGTIKLQESVSYAFDVPDFEGTIYLINDRSISFTSLNAPKATVTVDSGNKWTVFFMNTDGATCRIGNLATSSATCTANARIAVTGGASGSPTTLETGYSGKDCTVAGHFFDPLSLVKKGAGKWTLDSVFNNTGTITIDEGRVDFISGTPAGDNVSWIVNNGGTLGGYGTINGSVTFNAGAKLGVDIAADGTCAPLTVNGTVNLENMSLDIFGGSNLADAPYGTEIVLFRATGISGWPTRRQVIPGQDASWRIRVVNVVEGEDEGANEYQVLRAEKSKCLFMLTVR